METIDFAAEAKPAMQPTNGVSSEGLLANVFQYAPIGMALVSLEGRWLRVNPSVCRILGYTERELLALTFQELTHPDDLQLDLAQVGRLLNGESENYEIPKRYFHKDGREVTVLLTVSLVKGADQQPLHFISQIQDISEREKVSGSLRYEQSLLRDLMATCPDHIYFKDRQSRMVRVNAIMAERLGFSHPDEAVGLTDHDFFNPEHANQAFADEQRLMETGEILLDHVENEIWPDGRQAWVSSTKVPRCDEAGNIIGLIGISRDITARKQTEIELERLNKQLMDMSRMAGMSEVATSVLHNVGNVLNSVNISCTLISEKIRNTRLGGLAKVVDLIHEHEADLAGFFTENPVGKRLPEYLEKISQLRASEQESLIQEVDLLTQNIEHIKEIVTVQQSYANVGGITETMALAELAEDALRMISGGLTRHGIAFRKDYQPLPDFPLQKHKVLQILVNLVRNAKHALVDGKQPDKTLLIRIEKEDEEHAAIRVIDNGIGISREHLTRIFALGFTTKKRGHGFGLHSGVLAAREMGGKLTVHSDGLGKGAVFSLILPLNPSLAPQGKAL